MSLEESARDPCRRESRGPDCRACSRPTGPRRRRSPARAAWCAHRVESASATAIAATAPPACTSGPCRHPRRRAAAASCRHGRLGHSGRSRASRSRAGRLARASRRAARDRCSPRTGWGSPRPVGGDERLDDTGAEAVAKVEREMREPKRVRERARLRDGRGRAATALRVVLLVCPQLERDCDRLPVAGAEQRCNRAVDPTGHRDEGALRLGITRRVSPPAAAAAAPSARWSASQATSAACSLPGLSPPSSAAILLVPIRAASRSGAPVTRLTAALAAAVVAPQPSAMKPASVMRSPVAGQ